MCVFNSCNVPKPELKAVLKPKYCSNQITILTGSAQKTVNYNLDFSKEELYNSFATQLDTNICNSFCAFNTNITIDSNMTVPIEFITHRICPEDTFSNYPQACVLLQSIELLINANHQILFEGEIVDVDSLELKIKYLTFNRFFEEGNRNVIFYVVWNKNVGSNFRRTTIKKVIDGYLHAMDLIANKRYSKKVCELNFTEMKELKTHRKLKFCLRDYLPPPPPILLDLDHEDSLIVKRKNGT